jgi:ParB/RepB/Spo0J family partition protein
LLPHTKKKNMNTTPPTFAAQLIEARTTAGLSQQQAADLIGRPFRTLQNWEQGANAPHPQVRLIILAKLAGEKEQPEPKPQSEGLHSSSTLTRFVEIAEVEEFHLNPRRGKYRDLERLKQSLQDNGQETPLDLWRHPSGKLQVLQGHRRLKSMQELGWTLAHAFIREFTTEGHALAWLMNQQENNDPFDHVERSLACSDMLAAGLTMEETCRAVSRSPETVQLWLDLGKMPEKVHNNVRSGNVSLETVGALAKLEKAEQCEALQMVLKGVGGPMSTAQAKLMIEQRYILPKKHHAEWIALQAKLKKSHPVSAYDYAEWDARLTYVQGDTGQPENGYEWAEQAIPDSHSDSVASWGDAARKLGVKPVIVPAPMAKAEYVIVVHKPTVKTVDSDNGGEIFGKERTVKKSGGCLIEYNTPATPEEDQEQVPPIVEDSTPSELVNLRGITVAELKQHIAAWPENHPNGSPARIWLEAFGFPIVAIKPFSGVDMIIEKGDAN